MSISNQDRTAIAWTVVIVGVIVAICFGIPIYVTYLFLWCIPREIVVLILGGALTGTLFVLGKYWEKFVPQNPEFTNSLVRNPDGTMHPIIDAGPIFLRPGSVVEGNQIPRNVTSVPIEFKINRGDISVTIKGNVRYFPTDGKRLQTRGELDRALNALNQLGTEYKETLKSAISGFLERAGDIVCQEQKFSSLESILNHKGSFLEQLEIEFRNYETQLEKAFGIEILDKNKKGIDLTLAVPPEVEKELLKIFQQRRQAQAVREEAERLIKSAKESGQSLSFEIALELAAAIISGNIQRVSGSGRSGVSTILPIAGGQQNGG